MQHFVGLLAPSFKAVLNWRSHVAGIVAGMGILLHRPPIELAARFGEAEARECLLADYLLALQLIFLACQSYRVYSLLQSEPLPLRMSLRIEDRLRRCGMP